MSLKFGEILATGATLLALGVAVFWPFSHEEASARAGIPDGVRMITLTGVASAGVWTEEDVNGLNYWTSFPRARPVLVTGERVFLRLKSADVIHTFYCPGLKVGPIRVYPGHVEHVEVTPAVAGTFRYYCTTYCGAPHFAMWGEIVVGSAGAPVPAEEAGRPEHYWTTPPPPEAGRVVRGGWLFRREGCVTCHGEGGRGGVPNWNYVKDTVPALNTVAERMMLFEKEDADAIVKLIEKGTPLKSVAEDPPVPRFNVVLAQYGAITDLIRKGNPAGKKDPKGPVPPLQMGAWADRISDEDIDSILAYLLTLQPWEEEEEEK